jgi:hypothetical protein
LFDLSLSCKLIVSVKQKQGVYQMKKILFLTVLFVAMSFLAQSEESGVKVQTNGGSFEIKTGTPAPPPNPQVIVVRPSTPQVVEKTTVVQPKGGCGLVKADQ